MHPIHDVDSLLLLAIALSSKRRPGELVEMVAALDLIHGAIPPEPKLLESMQRLSVHGLIEAAGEGYTLSAEAQKIVAGQPKKAETEERVFNIKDKLSLYNPEERRAPVVIDAAQLAAAILAHKKLLSDSKRSLLVPKQKPPADNGRGPGFKKRKPMPARRRKD